MKEIEKRIIRQLLSNSDYVDFINSHEEYIDKERMLNLIANAPVSLYEKRNLFKLLSAQEEDQDSTGSYTKGLHQIEDALDNLTLKDKEIFIVKMDSANDGETEQYSLGPALSLDEVKEQIFYETDCETEVEFIEFAKQESYWITLDKYDLSKGKCLRKYNYELLGFTPVWFTAINQSENNSQVNDNDFSSFPALALPCPYKPGDIVKLDCRPHAPVEYAVILCNPISQMWDCCDPWVVYINKNGDYDMGALNHNAPVREHNVCAMSCLYRIEKISPDGLPKEREGLKFVSEFIAGSEEKGNYLDKYPFNGRITSKSMKRAIAEYEGLSDKSDNTQTRVIVCGGRGFTDYEYTSKILDTFLNGLENVEIVSGHAKGADTLGEQYADAHSIPCAVFPADWDKYGRAAGPIRNSQMIDYAMEENPIVIAFWDGGSHGTKDTLKKAFARNIPCIIARYGNTDGEAEK